MATFILKTMVLLHLTEMENMSKMTVELGSNPFPNNVSNNSEILCYTLLSSFEKKFQNSESNFKKIKDEFWGLLIPIAIKQAQLIFMKIIEYWYLLGLDYKLLEALSIDILNNK